MPHFMEQSVVLSGVGFWDMANEKKLSIGAGQRSICDAAQIPLPGDRVAFETDEKQFVVVYREFTFRNGTCHVTVNVQPFMRGQGNDAT